MKTGTAVALGIGGLVAVLVIGGAAVGGIMLLRGGDKGGGENAANDATRIAQLEQLKAQAESAAAIEQARATTAQANAAVEIAKTQAKAADKPWWEIAVTEVAGGFGDLIGSGKLF